MRAIAHDGYGPPDDLELRELEKPPVDDDGVLVRVRAASVNPVDWHLLRGEPYLVRAISGFRSPKGQVPGVDVAGVVEAVGANVTQFRPGDEVFGRHREGSLAEYVCGREANLAPKPGRLTWEQAAAIPVAGSTALQAVRDHGQLEPGQRVLVNGAAGGVGTFAVQIAKALGGEVTGVCSTRNIELVRSIGADRVVDYSVEDFAESGRYDLVLNICGNRSLADLRRALAPEGTLVLVGDGTGREEKRGGMLGPLATMIRGRLRSRFTRQRIRMFITKGRKDDLDFLSELVEAGKVMPVIDRSYPLAEAAEAIRYLEAGHARGKVVVTI